MRTNKKASWRVVEEILIVFANIFKLEENIPNLKNVMKIFRVLGFRFLAEDASEPKALTSKYTRKGKC